MRMTFIMPRDRDQAYSIMGDGLLMSLATRIIPSLQLMEGFTEEIRSVKGFNSSPKTFVLDMALLTETTSEQWLAQAKLIQERITPELIDEAFQYFPIEVRDQTVKRIKRILLARAERVQETAMDYYKVINRYATLIGTDKDDWFEIERMKINGSLYRIYFVK